MTAIENAFLDIGRFDRLAREDTWLHRLDPRTKLITTLVFLVCVVSNDRYELSALLPFALYPLLLASAGGVPLSFVGKRMLLVAPFIVMVGIVNPILDRETMLELGPVAVSAGWVSFLSILLRGSLTVATVIIVIAITGFDGFCAALSRLGAPRVLVVQLMFLYRYLFVLGGEAMRLVRARRLRSFGKRGLGIGVFSSLIGHLLLRTLERARRVHRAMLCRGFKGQVRLTRELHPGIADLGFVFLWCAFFVGARQWNLPQLVGALLSGGA